MRDKERPHRERTRRVSIGGIPVGGGAPVSIQSMTLSSPVDVKASIEEIQRLADAGVDIVRTAVPNEAAADLLPELQGRLPIRVELKALSRDDFARILREPENSLVIQYRALMGTEDVTLEFTDDAIEALADLSAEINSAVENIGARRLHTVMEKLLEEISFTATDRAGEAITIDAGYVRARVGELAKDADLSKFIL